MRSLTITFSDQTLITLPLIEAIGSHPRLFEIAIENLQAQFINKSYCDKLDTELRYSWVRFDKSSQGSTPVSTDQNPEESYCDKYILANKEKFEPCVNIELFRGLNKLFASKSLAIVRLPQLYVPTRFNARHYGFYERSKNNDVITRAISTYDVIKKFTLDDTESAKELKRTVESNHRLSVVILNHGNRNKSNIEYIDFRTKTHDHFISLYSSLICEAHKQLGNYDLLATKEILENLEMLLASLKILIEDPHNCLPKAPDPAEYERLKASNRVLLTAHYEFDDPLKRHQAFLKLWEKRKEDPVLAGFLINLLLSADVSQLPFLNHAHEKYYLIMALFADHPATENQTLLRHAFHNAIKVAINPTAASDEMVLEEAGDNIEYNFDRCVFFCTLVNFLREQEGISTAALDTIPCSIVGARELLRKIPRPSDTSAEKMFNLLLAYIEPNHKADLFVSVKEALFKSIQAWINDPFQFEKDKMKREFRQEMLRNQQQTISLLKEQNRLLEEVRKNTQSGPLKLQVRQESMSQTSPKMF